MITRHIATSSLCTLLALPFAISAQPAPQPTSQPANQPPVKPAPDAQPAGKPAARPPNTTIPVPRDREDWWVQRHEAAVERAKHGAEKGDVGIIFLGDSITQGWEGPGKEAWDKHFAPLSAINLGFSGDRTQHVLWRLDHGEIEGLASPKAGTAPKLVVLMIGTNNSHGNDNTAEQIAEGLQAIVGSLRAKLPQTKILVLAIFPRGEKPNPQREKIAKASELASKLADGSMVHYLDIGPTFLEKDQTIHTDIMDDFLHLTPKGYQMWADAILPKVKELAK
ncbi:MAG: GDSL family lipase [Phycisphaerales bacterium]|nr:GDSL family lipase [Phycisphaerales bacterium]